MQTQLNEGGLIKTVIFTNELILISELKKETKYMYLYVQTPLITSFFFSAIDMKSLKKERCILLTYPPQSLKKK
jgi:hypothetical protein